MHILVTNDDGVFAPGIFALQQALREIPDARVTLVAPQENQSAVGHRKTLRDPLRIRQFTLSDGTPAHACSGSPADAVALSLMGYIKEPVDIVVSGINQGGNMGQDITYSGTVTAAMEATIFGVPAIAISLDSHTEPAFRQAAAFAARFTPVVLEHGLPPMTLLNINVPLGTPKGVKVTRQGRRIYHDQLVEREDPSGRPYYWIGGEVPTGDITDEGTDMWAVANGFISITPIHLDLTYYDYMSKLEEWHITL
ncbi:MAG: 5'/3'-nucleotidase SurE [Anaerolineae bacterium]